MSGVSIDLLILMRKYPHLIPVYKFGHSESIDTSPEDVWEAGGTYPFQTSAVSIEAVSTSANDTAAGSGIRTIIVEGLDSNHDAVTATITMNGTSASASPSQQFLRVNRAYGVTCGASGGNEGTITIRIAGGGAALAYMELHANAVPMGQTQMAIYTVPRGHNAYLVNGTAGIESNKSADFYMRHRVYHGGGEWGPWRTVETGLGLTMGAFYDLAAATKFVEMEDVKVTCLASAINTRVTASFFLMLEKFG